MEQDSYSI